MSNLWDLMDYKIPGSSVYGISGRILEGLPFPSPQDINGILLHCSKPPQNLVALKQYAVFLVSDFAYNLNGLMGCSSGLGSAPLTRLGSHLSVVTWVVGNSWDGLGWDELYLFYLVSNSILFSEDMSSRKTENTKLSSEAKTWNWHTIPSVTFYWPKQLHGVLPVTYELEVIQPLDGRMLCMQHM